jgi:CRP/FNR family cyclic AMP-dependent transcriptional regulator
MQPENLTELLRKHPFISDLEDKHLRTLLSCASNVVFSDGDYLFREGEEATKFYLIRTGKIALELHGSERGLLRIQTVGQGEVLGWSWLISPYRWHFDAIAVEDVRAFSLDGKCLRTKCEDDHDFGYEMYKRFSKVLENRIKATRLQLLDVYGVDRVERG